MRTLDLFSDRRAMPHMVWLDKPKGTLQIPGTDLRFEQGFDFGIEHWSPEDYAHVHDALMGHGVVGQTSRGNWVFFQFTKRDPVMRLATDAEVGELAQLPRGWEGELALDASKSMQLP